MVWGSVQGVPCLSSVSWDSPIYAVLTGKIYIYSTENDRIVIIIIKISTMNYTE